MSPPAAGARGEILSDIFVVILKRGRAEQGRFLGGVQKTLKTSEFWDRARPTAGMRAVGPVPGTRSENSENLRILGASTPDCGHACSRAGSWDAFRKL